MGDIVKLKTGTSAIVVRHVTKHYVSGEYLASGTISGPRPIEEYEPYEENKDKGVYQSTVTAQPLWENTGNNKPENIEDDKMTNTLYQFKDANDNVLFGTYLATNSDGKWVMEDRSSKNIVVVDKKDVEEVLPYTISVKFAKDGVVYSYLSDKGKFDLGFYLVTSGDKGAFHIAQVTAVDTKSKAATKEFTPIGKLNVDLY